MTNVVVVGAQWGDEGKGKIVDWLSERADIVVRFQGGHNAGHTLVIGDMTYKLSLLPSGVVREGKLGVIGNGVVIDPWALREEIARLRAQGLQITPENLRIAENATLIYLCIANSTCGVRKPPGTVRSVRRAGASAQPTRIRLAAVPYGSMISLTWTRSVPSLSAFSSITTRCGVGWAGRSSRRRL